MEDMQYIYINTSIINEGENLCVLPYELTENQWDFYYAFSWWMEGFGAILIGCIGILLNCTTIFVLLSGDLAASFFNWLLVCLAVFDNFFLLSGILEAFRNHIGSTNFHDYMFVMFFYPFRATVMLCSIYTTMMLALERHNAMTKPLAHQGNGFRSGRRSLKKYLSLHGTRLLKYIGPIVLCSTLFHIPKLLEVGIESHQNCKKPGLNDSCNFGYEIAITRLRSNNHYNLWYLNIGNLLVTVAIPLVSLTYLNVSIYLKFKQFLQRQPLVRGASDSNDVVSHTIEKLRKREKDMVQQTRVLFSIVILFGLFHILRIILNIEEFTSLDEMKKAKEVKGCEWLQYWTIISSAVSHLLLQINSSVNFVIYCYFNKSFRDELISRLNLISTFFKVTICCRKKEERNSDTKLNNSELDNAKNFETKELNQRKESNEYIAVLE